MKKIVLMCLALASCSQVQQEKTSEKANQQTEEKIRVGVFEGNGGAQTCICTLEKCPCFSKGSEFLQLGKLCVVKRRGCFILACKIFSCLVFYESYALAIPFLNQNTQKEI